MKRSLLLLVDALINLLLGLLLITFPAPVVETLSLPQTQTRFYSGVLGAVLLGIAIALSIEWRRSQPGLVGLGFGGAVAINLCAAVAVAVWLLTAADTSLRGTVVLWLVVAALVIISSLEILVGRKDTHK